MEELFITKIDIEKSRNVENVTIDLSETERKHLILTGKNGSGKTTLLRELNYFLDLRANQGTFDVRKAASFQSYNYKPFFKTKLSFSAHLANVSSAWKSHSFITVFFDALRNSEIYSPKEIKKLNIWKKEQFATERLGKYFLQFLVNQKADRSFAKDDGDFETVQKIDDWFNLLENQLKKIFETDQLELKFIRNEYTFEILIPDRESFGFEVLSDGYSSIISIVAELIMRMEKLKRDANIYDLQGVVLIDEIETHLHVSLQKIILPILTDFFPKIQFIVSTHSPFVLSSISSAVIFDLENKTVIEDLSQYSYDAIIESYFDSDKYSEEIKGKIEEYDQLSLIESKTPEQIHQFRQLKDYFDNVPTYKAPELKAKLLEIDLRSIKSKTTVD